MDQADGEKVFFFGYGAYRNKSKLAQVLGHAVSEGVGAILEGHVLVYQTIDQLPESLQEFFRNTYGNNFKAYTIRKGNGVISGMIWEINKQDLETLKKWEFVPEWREIVEVNVKSSGEKMVTAYSEKAQDDQPFHEITDGVEYEEFENKVIPKVDAAQKEYYTKQQIENIKQWLYSQTKRN